MRELSNNELMAERAPDPEGDLDGWEQFAHTINGYDVMDGFEACADLANSHSAVTLTELWCSLFFEARRERHSGVMSVNEEVVRHLLRAIRQKLLDGDLD